MLAEILARNLKVVFVGTAVSQASDELGFYYLGSNNQFWDLLEFTHLTPKRFITESEKNTLTLAKDTGVLTEEHKKAFFAKKENELLALKIGLTDLNRRKVMNSDRDPDAEPKQTDVLEFIKKIEKFKPKTVAFLMNKESFVRSFKQLYPSVNGEKGKQEFAIHSSEVWLLGSTNGRKAENDSREQAFEDLVERLNDLRSTDS